MGQLGERLIHYGCKARVITHTTAYASATDRCVRGPAFLESRRVRCAMPLSSFVKPRKPASAVAAFCHCSHWLLNPFTWKAGSVVCTKDKRSPHGAACDAGRAAGLGLFDLPNSRHNSASARAHTRCERSVSVAS
ncbi:hypothetical protein MRX96_042279 [Rhipicephalus microplus]